MDVLNMLDGRSEFPAYAWPGGYPIYYIADDGGVLCPTCVNKEIRRVVESTVTAAGDGFELVGAEVNWEDAALFCEHCNKRVQSAYAEAQ